MWHVKKGEAFAEVQEVKPTSEAKTDGWSGFQFQVTGIQQASPTSPSYCFTELKDEILLDTGSTLGATFMNPGVRGIKASKTPIKMSTNAGVKLLTSEGEVPGFGMAWFDPTQMANIFGFSKLVDKHRVTYDSALEDAFIVHFDNGRTLKFKRTPQGLYSYHPTNHFKEQVAKTKQAEATKDRSG